MKSLKLVSLSFALLLSACASNVIVDLPYARVESPDVIGENLRPSIGVGGTANHKVEVVSDGQTRPPVLRTTNKDRGVDLPLSGDIGIAKNFQFGLRLGPLASSVEGVAKYSVFDSPTESGKANDFLLAFFASFGREWGSSSGDQERTFGPGGYNWRATEALIYKGVGGSLGYRITDNFLVYSGVARNWYDDEIRVTQDRSDDGLSAGGTYEKSAGGGSSTVALGLRWGRQVNVDFYGAYTKLHFSELPDIHQTHVGITLQFILK